ncbi:MAG: ABC transporter permease [Oscillospiraceae bacterium]|nr:ABC transporter permease [Oscillospiraceae bacterium]
MKNNQTSNVGTVFRYTVQQHYKTMSVKIFLIVLFVLSIAAIPLLRSLAGSDSEVSSSDITKLRLCNQTEYAISADDIRADERYADLEVIDGPAEKDALRQYLHDNDTAAAAVISMDESGMGFKIEGYYGEDSKISENDAETLTHVLEDALHQALLRTLEVTQEQIDTVNTKVFSTVASVPDYLSGDKAVMDTSTHMIVNLYYSYAVMIVIALAMSYIFQLCMEEKVSKLVEALLVSVKPAALLTGKILAVTFFIFGGIALIAVGLIISYHIAKSTGDVSFIKDFFANTFGMNPDAIHLGLKSWLMIAACLLLAYFIGAFFSGIVGSCCSKTEDTQQASIAVVVFLMIGYFTASFTPAMESDGVNYFVSLFPLTGMFTALPNYLCGKIPLAVLLGSLAIQIVAVILLAKLAGAVYRMMLLYSGGFPKPAQLIRMLRENRGTAKPAAGKED